ncbi:unnamed protein product [Coccothraustes coccothraustes]
MRSNFKDCLRTYKETRRICIAQQLLEINLLLMGEQMLWPSQTHPTAGTVQQELHSHLQTKYHFGANLGTGEAAGPQSEAIQPGLRVGPGAAHRLERQSTPAAPPGKAATDRAGPPGRAAARRPQLPHLPPPPRPPPQPPPGRMRAATQASDAPGQPPFSLGAPREM